MGRTVSADGRKGPSGRTGSHATGNLNGKIPQFLQFFKVLLVNVQLFQLLQAHGRRKINVLDFFEGRYKGSDRTGKNLQLLFSQLFKGLGDLRPLQLQPCSGIVHALVGGGVDFICVGVIHNGLYGFPCPGKAGGGSNSNKQ